MGGTVNLAVRLHDGKIIAREGYTSGICPLFQNDRFFDYDIFHIQEIFKCYEDKVTLSPDCYGLVFGDHVTRKIHSWQGYTNPATFNGSGLSLDIDGAVLYGSDEAGNYSDWTRFQRMFKKGYIKEMRQWEKDVGFVGKPLPDTIEGVHRLIKPSPDRIVDSFRGDFLVEVDGWQIIDYDEDKNGLRQFLQALKDDGIEIDEQTQYDWDEFMKDMWEEEEEEEV